MLATTLNKIRKHEPCQGGWNKLLSSLGKTKADDEHVTLEHILSPTALTMQYGRYVL